jgi:hypothetical protein
MTDHHPRQELGKLLRKILHCPGCDPGLGSMMDAFAAPSMRSDKPSLRIVAYRPKSIRLECPQCGLRFSIDPENFADVAARQEVPPPSIIEQHAKRLVADNPSQYLDALAATKAKVARKLAERRSQILSLHLEGVQKATPRKGQIRFPKRTKEQS